MKTLIRFILGAVFIVSGVAKAIDTQTFIGLIQAYDIGFLAYAAIIIPPLEILLGLFFWFNIEIKTAALIMMISTVLFSVVFLEVLLTKGIKDCGCFGSIKFLQMPPWGTVLRNILIVSGAYFLYKFPPPASAANTKIKFVIVAIIGFAAFTVSAVSYTKPLINVNTINHEDLTGRDVNSTFLKNYQKFDPKKRYAVFMFSPECFHCWDMTFNIKSLVESGYVDETIAFSPFELMAEEKKYEAVFKPNFKVNFITQKQFDAVTSVTPVLMIIQNNKIISYNNTGVIHSGYTIQKFNNGDN
jgi:hypothetical protein